MNRTADSRPAEDGKVGSKDGRTRRAGLLVLAAVAIALISPLIGPVPIPFFTVIQILGHQLTGGLLVPGLCSGPGAAGSCAAYMSIVWDERIPAILLAATAGTALAISGATLQGVFRNPLADPYLLGLSAGGSLGAAV